MHKVYISGPYRADTEWAVCTNISNARLEAVVWWNLGAAVFCPHSNSAHMGGAAPDSRFLRADLEFLSLCDSIVMLPGWRDSAGSRAEHEFAYSRRMLILYRCPALGQWHLSGGIPFSIDEARALCGVSTSPTMEDMTTPQPSGSGSSSSCPPARSTDCMSQRCSESSPHSCPPPPRTIVSSCPAQQSWSPLPVQSSQPATPDSISSSTPPSTPASPTTSSDQ